MLLVHWACSADWKAVLEAKASPGHRVLAIFQVGAPGVDVRVVGVHVWHWVGTVASVLEPGSEPVQPPGPGLEQA